MSGVETQCLPRVDKFPCSNYHCDVLFKLVLGIFSGDHVFCSVKCSEKFAKSYD